MTQEIIALANSSRYIARLIGLRLTQWASKRGATEITVTDLGNTVRLIKKESELADRRGSAPASTTAPMVKEPQHALR